MSFGPLFDVLCLAEAVQFQEVPLDPLWILEPELLWVGGLHARTQQPIPLLLVGVATCTSPVDMNLEVSRDTGYPSSSQASSTAPGHQHIESRALKLLVQMEARDSSFSTGVERGQGEQRLTLACALGPANGSLPFGSAALLAHRERKGMQATLMSPERLRSKGEGGCPSGPSSLQAPQRSRGEEPGRKGRVSQPYPEDGLRWSVCGFSFPGGGLQASPFP